MTGIAYTRYNLSRIGGHNFIALPIGGFDDHPPDQAWLGEREAANKVSPVNHTAERPGGSSDIPAQLAQASETSAGCSQD